MISKILAHLNHREGCRLTVYADSLGKPTVGVGHLVLPEDNLKIGDKITQFQMQRFLSGDVALALDAAKKQAIRLGQKDNEEFILALTSMCFQLGANWPSAWPNTFNLLKHREYSAAIVVFENSLWMKQTPVRVNDFIKALQKLESDVKLPLITEKGVPKCWIKRMFYFLKP